MIQELSPSGEHWDKFTATSRDGRLGNVSESLGLTRVNIHGHFQKRLKPLNA
jgi:hypothetical protein